ncbi:MAG: FliH/SctL family protein [Pseudolabrys sp.]|nr:FliH/SctL family protein [Pseudolabrys sp.]MDP2298543.1 FliH/SctL family protein [Pseudolabrys sp.]
MKPAAKYMFDEDFAPGGAKPTMTVVEHERRSADAEAVAHRKGFEAGQAQARTEASECIARALTQIADSMARLHGALGGIEAKLETEAVQVAVSVARKLAPELVAREPLVEIGALAGECFRQLVTTPQISIHIGADIFDAAKHELEEIARLRGFDGRLSVHSDAAIVSGDCRIEWADGGVNRDTAATLAAIDDVVGRYVAARTAPLN